RLGGHQDPRRAVAALGRAEIGETLLQRMQPAAGGEPFDRFDPASLRLDGEHEAGQQRLSVHEHGAGAALPQLAAVLRAGEPEVFAQHLEQRLVIVGEQLDRLVVDGERQADLHDDLTIDSVRRAAGVRAATPRTRKREMTSPTAAAVSGPSGRNQVTVQFIAPSIARATTAGSMSTSSPAFMPSAI